MSACYVSPLITSGGKCRQCGRRLVELHAPADRAGLYCAECCDCQRARTLSQSRSDFQVAREQPPAREAGGLLTQVASDSITSGHDSCSCTRRGTRESASEAHSFVSVTEVFHG